MLDSYGWSERLQQHFQPFAARDMVPGRVTVQQRGRYRVATPVGELDAELSGRFAHTAADGDFPVAGDWVVAAARASEGAATIHHLLPRSSAFVRKTAGDTAAGQVVAANADLAFLVASLNDDLNLRRIERYLALAWESGAAPVVVLTKADLCADVAAALVEVRSIAPGAEVLAVSSANGHGLEALSALLGAGRTAVLLGSSGVGKSTLLNALAGTELMATQAIREDDARGRHTTTHRELVRLPTGGLLLDTPGMRELGLWNAGEGLASAFQDVEALAARCRFRDCGHHDEPGCAVQAALTSGALSNARWRNYQKLQRENAHHERRGDARAEAEARQVWIRRAKDYRAGKKARERWS